MALLLRLSKFPPSSERLGNCGSWNLHLVELLKLRNTGLWWSWAKKGDGEGYLQFEIWKNVERNTGVHFSNVRYETLNSTPGVCFPIGIQKKKKKKKIKFVFPPILDIAKRGFKLIFFLSSLLKLFHWKPVGGSLTSLVWFTVENVVQRGTVP